jgi:hypothetical protein
MVLGGEKIPILEEREHSKVPMEVMVTREV